MGTALQRLLGTKTLINGKVGYSIPRFGRWHFLQVRFTREARCTIESVGTNLRF